MRSRAPLLLSSLIGLGATGSDDLAANDRMAAGCVAERGVAERGVAERGVGEGRAGDAAQLAELSLAVHVGSRLLARDAGRLELRRGAPLPCSDPQVSALQHALQGPASALPLALLPRPLHVHVDPRLPAGEAPLGAAEVHVSSRELLVTHEALAQLPTQAWRHELLHVLAAPPPPASEVARRLWLTLEEGLVQYATQRSEQGAAARDTAARDTAARDTPVDRDFPALPAPVWEQLALPAYDPHELARGWASELARTQPPLELPGAVGCLRAPAAAVNTLQQAARAFVKRCPADVAPVLQLALQRWLPEEWREPERPVEAPDPTAFSRRAR